MRTTSSSISSSEAGGRAWRGFALCLALTAAGLAALLVALIFVVDPYNSGRSTLLTRPGVAPMGPRTAHASLGRDPAYDGVVIGNSHVQLLSPARLSALTGIPFAQLSAPGTGPREQVVLLDWFLRHREREPKAIILGVDPYWCRADPDMPTWEPFPFWLYSDGLAAYLRGLVRYSVLEELPRRIAYWLGAERRRSPPDGYVDYDLAFLAAGRDADPARRAALESRGLDRAVVNLTGRHPAAEMLAGLVARLPPGVAVVILHPPAYVAAQPHPGTPEDASDRACKEAFARVAAARAGTVVVDWRSDRPETREPNLFWDQTHYRRALAQQVEADIARALASLGRGTPAGP
jgi:hypothetical protein